MIVRSVYKKLFLVFFLSGVLHASPVDLVVFSFDRPLQLYALLESVQTYITGLETVSVIYRASSDEFLKGYEVVRETFPRVTFFKQGQQPRGDFKPLLLKAVFDAASPYILFAVDDIIVTDHINLDLCIECLEKSSAYGFYLRLGKNLDFCYSYQAAQRVPSLIQVADGVYAWQLGQGQYDWGYPNTVDMTLYRKADIRGDLYSMQYWAPNSFEAAWSGRSASVMGRKGLCFYATKIVNLPLNRVQHEFHNKHMNSYTPHDLLTVFSNQSKIDIYQLSAIDNKAAHMEYVPIFTVR